MSREKYIRNEYVKMDWKADCFFESREDECFVAAVQEYETDEGTVAVLFMDNNTMVVANESGEICSVDELFERVAKNYKEELPFEDVYEADITYLDDDNMSEYGLSEDQIEDVHARFADLAVYNEETWADAEGNEYSSYE